MSRLYRWDEAQKVESSEHIPERSVGLNLEAPSSFAALQACSLEHLECTVLPGPVCTTFRQHPDDQSQACSRTGHCGQ